MEQLEAIRYARGNLELVDQRLFPLEKKYLSITSVEEGWDAIRSMVVRGAPAIGVAAALSLAVELAIGGGGSQFESAQECADTVASKMEYLVTSRPTAVNITDTHTKLKALCAKEVEKDGATASSVAEAVILACEAMLEEDVRTNKAIGKFGAESIETAASSRGLGEGGKFRVLTHCNTGSLATAGYGTALGVIRALHEQGKLAHAYCCETRPYNQGSRLTAYELVHDGLPSTLICDSMAAALMSQKKVDAIVVGVDRTARNGDAANKIGTLSLAIIAQHFDIPFFVAAPSTSIDLATENGSLIDIEERPAEEITHFRGERVAPEGVKVWNPAFDVTPAKMIEGIVTEKGTIYKADGEFKIAEFLGSDASAVNGATAPPGFKALDLDSAKEYVAARPDLAKIVGPPETVPSWTCSEIGDGNINFIYLIKGPEGSMILKQGLPFVRCVGESWPLTQDRVRVEAESLIVERACCEEHVPEVYGFDEKMAVIAMEYLAPPHVILRNSIEKGDIYPLAADHVAKFMAETLFHTSLLATDSEKFKEEVKRFTNPQMCKLTEQVIFMDPYFHAPMNRWTSPALDSEIRSLWNDMEAKLAAADLRRKFMCQPEALIHGDLHTGSLMVTKDTTYAIDSEFAFYGPMGFDVGKIIGNFFLGYFSVDGYASEGDPRTEQREWLLESAGKIWPRFESCFLKLWRSNPANGDLYPTDLVGGVAFKNLQDDYMYRLWQDVLGFCGAVIIRRLVGIAHVPEMESIKDIDAKGICEQRALSFGRRLLTEARDENAFPNMDVLVQLARDLRNDGQQPYYN
ncbi:hypothetical protein BSKO_09168 [Bryopsis sp. KO-2023]|nr:hypothetical protein BSKO_09168 [Bryopsis sp. KO-2023]